MGNAGQDRFAVLVAPHLVALFRMAHRLLRSTPDAQDLVQDVCVTAYGRLADIDPEASLRWLLCSTIASSMGSVAGAAPPS